MQYHTVSDRAKKEILVCTLMKKSKFWSPRFLKSILNGILPKINYKPVLPSCKPKEYNYIFSFPFLDTIMNISDLLKP